jgi:anti-sigma B factor antagonist
MFDIKISETGDVILVGRFDAAQAEKAGKIFNSVNRSCTVDMTELEYISSAGLGILLATYKRLDDSGEKIVLRNMNPYIRKIFHVCGLDRVFQIE